VKILLAVSGGADSTYLALKARDFFPGAGLGIAHCNFCLRGEESDGDEMFVRELSRKLQIKFYSKRFDTASFASVNGVSVEMAARSLRYGWFAELCAEGGFDAVAVAHNASDNAETLLLNMLRGCGTKGLRGMSADSVCEFGCRVLRPMLDISREEITAFLEEKGQTWREDRTNSENEYKRNKLRNLVLPVFREINPSYLRTLQTDMKHVAQVDDIAQEYYEQEKSKVVLPDGSIDIAALNASRHIEYLLWRLTGEQGSLSDEQFDGLLDAVMSDKPSSGKRFGPFVVTKGKIMVVPSSVEAAEYTITEVRASELTSLKTPEGMLLLDKDKLPGGFRTRLWQAGDWMRPLGMKRGRKKLSDLFVDLGWDERQKASATVVELEGSHVAALLFARIDDEVKISGNTKMVLQIQNDIQVKSH